MSLTCVKNQEFENVDCSPVFVSIWKNKETNKISLEIRGDSILDSVDIGNANDVRQLNYILTKAIEIMEELETKGSVD